MRRLRPLALALAFATGAAAFAGHAAAPAVRTQAPGYYRLMLGAFEVTALSDGTTALPMGDLLQRASKPEIEAALAAHFLKDPVEASFNAYLVNTGERLVLIDTGAGALFGPTLGQLGTALRAAGYAPEQVDDILITHFHPDHVGGLVRDGQRAFPNATVHADRRDVDEWLSVEKRNAAPKDAQGFYDGARAALEPYRAAGKLHGFDGGGELLPGIRAVSSYGHTPGHTVYEVRSGGQTLVVIGDLLHQAAIQFDRPEVTIAFDSDQDAAARARRAVFDAAAADGRIVAASHIAFPGLGRVRADGDGYDWVPVNYAVPR